MQTRNKKLLSFHKLTGRSLTRVQSGHIRKKMILHELLAYLTYFCYLVVYKHIPPQVPVSPSIGVAEIVEVPSRTLLCSREGNMGE